MRFLEFFPGTAFLQKDQRQKLRDSFGNSIVFEYQMRYDKV